MSYDFARLRPLVRKALNVLGIRNFLLSIHDAAFPSLPGEDIGRGSPYSHGAFHFVRFASDLGFNGFQFGPQGITSPLNPSPYDATLFSRNPLSLAPLRLTEKPWNLIQAEWLSCLLDGQAPPVDRVEGDFAEKAMGSLLVEIGRWVRKNSDREGTGFQAALLRSFNEFLQNNGDWLERDGLYEVLRSQYGGRSWKAWGESAQALIDKRLFAPPRGGGEAARKRKTELKRRHRNEMEEYFFIQFLLHWQHRKLRKHCRLLDLRLFGDCQIGLSGRDIWSAQSFLLADYLLGAPPSRTNPEGQPWNYPVPDPHKFNLFDPEGNCIPGPARVFFRRRIDKLFQEFDGIRIDHPHGLICPWVYRADREDTHKAVQEGARLFASPALADHPRLAELAIVRPDQINPREKRYADDWVMNLEPDQIRRYAVRFEEIMASAREYHRGSSEIACEILSTRPYPIRKVMELYGLGHFLVTQKADLKKAHDVYRCENAQPQDWVMLGNHDTSSIWQVTERWLQDGECLQQAEYLAKRLDIAAGEREKWIRRVAGDSGELAQAKFANLFIGPAQNIMVFFTDLLGIRQSYNIPGTVSQDNWSLRIDSDYPRQYIDKLRKNLALNIPKALAMALRARGDDVRLQYRNLIEDLESWPVRFQK